MRWLVVAASMVVLAPVATAQSAAMQKRLNACIDKIDDDPDEAYEDALQWAGERGPPEARQCVALALIGKKRYEEGAFRLETLANDKDAGGLDTRALYLAQAGNAWLLAGAPEASIVALTNAMKLTPKDSGLFIDRARAQIVLKNWDEATKDLDSAVRLSPGNSEALGMRAHVRLNVGRLDDAWTDVTAAMRQAPKNVDLLVMRGQIREAMRAKGMKDPEGLE